MPVRNSLTSVVVVTLGLVAPLSLPVAAPVAAQEVMSFSVSTSIGGGRDFQPDIARRELTRYMDILGMDEMQRAVAESLYESYRTEQDAISTEARERMTELMAEFEETEDATVFIEDLPKVHESFSESNDALTTGFFDDLRGLLNDDQADRWPVLERTRRRIELLPMGHLAGESVDLIELVDDLKLDEDARAEVADPLAQYELELDRALQERAAEREAQRRETEKQRKENAVEGTFPMIMLDPDEMQERMARMHEHSVRIRDVNDRWFRQIVGLLPDAVATEAERRFRELSFPEVYRPAYAGEVIGAALAFDDLTDDQRRAIEAIRASYDRDIERVNRDWSDAIRKQQEQSESGMMMIGNDSVFIGESETDELSEARRGRRELDRRVLDGVRDLLTDAQKERLPARSTRHERVRTGGATTIRAFEVIQEDEQ